MRLKIERYVEPAGGHHECRDLDTNEIHRVDLFVDGTLDDFAQNPEALVGKTVEVERFAHYLELGCGVRLLSEEQEAASAAADVTC